MKLYEGMFLLDNQVVREDWAKAKATVTDTLQKHGAKILSARHWDERKLAYPIKGKTRGTYVLSYFECGNEVVNGMRRDLELDETILRYLLLSVDAIPEGELEKSQAEGTAEFVIPTPPVEEALTAERAIFGELADRPVVDRSRSRRGESENTDGDGADDSADSTDVPDEAEATSAGEGA